MSMQEALAAAPWSLMAPTATAPRAAVGRVEDIEEARRFDAAMRRAELDGKPNTAPVEPIQAIRTGRPEERDGAGAAETPTSTAFFGEDGLTFGDLVDIVNPLQHIPGVSSVYRALTGDEVSPGARLAGGALYGGPIGAAGAIANNVSLDLTGEDLGGAMITALTGDSPPDAPSQAGPALAAAPATLEDAATNAAAIAPAAAQPTTIQAATPPPAPVAANPFFASQPTGVPFAVMPTGASPIAPPSAAMTSPPPSPVTAAATGVPQLSPESAEILMRMSQESAAPPPPPPSTQAAPATTTTTASATDGADGPRATQTAGFIDSVATEDLPAAMMEALAKYQEMKAGQ